MTKPRAETQMAQASPSSIHPHAWPSQRYAGREQRSATRMYAHALRAKYDPGSVELRLALDNLSDGVAGISLSEYQQMRKGS